MVIHYLKGITYNIAIRSTVTISLCFFSIAILRYIQNKYNLHDHWYPKDVYKRGQVDEALAWFPGNLRCSAFFFTVSALYEYAATAINKLTHTKYL